MLKRDKQEFHELLQEEIIPQLELLEEPSRSMGLWVEWEELIEAAQTLRDLVKESI